MPVVSVAVVMAKQPSKIGEPPEDTITMKAKDDRPERCCHWGYGNLGGKG